MNSSISLFICSVTIALVAFSSIAEVRAAQQAPKSIRSWSWVRWRLSGVLDLVLDIPTDAPTTEETKQPTEAAVPVTTTAESFKCTEEGFFTIPENEFGFFVCKRILDGSLKQAEGKCPDGTKFDEKLVECVLIYPVSSRIEK